MDSTNQTGPRFVCFRKRTRGQKTSTSAICRRQAAAICSRLGWALRQNHQSLVVRAIFQKQLEAWRVDVLLHGLVYHCAFRKLPGMLPPLVAAFRFGFKFIKLFFVNS